MMEAENTNLVNADSSNSNSLLVISNKNGCKELIVTDNIRLGTYLHNTGISDASRPAYKRTLVKFFSFYSTIGISEVTDIHINLYIKSLPVGDSTKNFVIKVLSSFFTYMFKTGYISQNPSAVIRQIKVADKLQEKILSFEQVKRMIETEQNVRNQTFLIVLYYAGLRVSEALSIKWKNFRVLQDGAAQLTIVGKGRKARTLYIPEDIYNIICGNLIA
jgi:integrase/recombinase XerD